MLQAEVRLPSCRLDCLLMRLDRDPTTEFLFLNLQKVLKQCDKNIMTHTNSHFGTVYSRISPLTCLQRLLDGCHGSLDVSLFKGHGRLHHQDAAVTQRVVHAVLPPTHRHTS